MSIFLGNCISDIYKIFTNTDGLVENLNDVTSHIKFFSVCFKRLFRKILKCGPSTYVPVFDALYLPADYFW